MSCLNHLFLVYILFYFPGLYLCSISKIIWNDIVLYPYPHLRVRDTQGDLEIFLVLWIHLSGAWDLALLENGWLYVSSFVSFKASCWSWDEQWPLRVASFGLCGVFGDKLYSSRNFLHPIKAWEPKPVGAIHRGWTVAPSQASLSFLSRTWSWTSAWWSHWAHME